MSSDDLKEAKDNFFQAIEIMRGESKTNILLFGSPLVALMSQLRFILTVESTIVKGLLTVSILSLLLGTLASLYSQSFTRAWHAKEILVRSGEIYAGANYVNYMAEIYNQVGLTLDEDGALKLSRKLTNPLAMLMLLGWLPLVAALIFVVWK